MSGFVLFLIGCVIGYFLYAALVKINDDDNNNNLAG